MVKPKGEIKRLTKRRESVSNRWLIDRPENFQTSISP